MNAAKIKFAYRMSNEQKKWCFRLTVVLWMICSILAVIAYRIPLEVEQKVRTSLIKKEVNFKYSADALPEGIVSLSDAIFTKSQKQIKVYIKSMVSSDKPVRVKGTSSVAVKLVAEELWEKTIQTYPEKVFLFEGKENKLMDMEVNIDLEVLYAELERISNEIIGARPKNYCLKIKPEIKGEITSNDAKFPIQNEGEFILSLEGEQVKPVGERIYITEIPVEETRLVKQVLSILGVKLDLITSRYAFGASSILLLLLIVFVVIKRIKSPKKDTISEAMEIDKKYGIRLITIQKSMEVAGKICLELQSFKALIRISDEKDRGILKYEDKSAHQVHYYLVDGEYIYSYKAGLESVGITAVHDGGDISYGM